MIKNYFKIAFRNLTRYWGYSVINIGGLAIGIACCLLIFQYISYEYSFDQFNENAGDIYRVNQTTVLGNGEPSTGATVGWAMGPALARETPEVLRYVRLHPEYNNAVISNPSQPDKVFEEERVYYADPAFFQMFSYPLVSGSREPLAEPGTIMMSQSVARKYFGDEDPSGQTVEVNGWITGEFRVSGVFQDVPVNSHLQFDILLPMVDLLQKSQFSDPLTGWGWENFITYVQLHENADLAAVEQKFTEVLMDHQEGDWQQTYSSWRVGVQPLQDIHLNEDILAPGAVMGSYRSVYFFTVIALVIFLIALVNYINLATARALNRAREVGVRKAVGARKGQLIGQFLTESSLTILLATLFGIALAEIVMPVVNNVAGMSVPNAMWTSAGFWIVFPAIFLIATLFAGLYPAFVLSSVTPAVVLKGKTGTSAAGSGLRRGLVVFQFAVSIILLAGTVIIYSQLNYMRTMDLGMELEEVLVVSGPRVLPEGVNRANAVETFSQQLNQLPAIWQTATSSTVPGQGFNFHGDGFRKAAADRSTEVRVAGTNVDTSFVNLYDFELIADENMTTISYPVLDDEVRLRPILINETAAEALGFNNPAEAMGEELTHGRVIGVLKDFSWSSAHQVHQNIILILMPGNSQISIKVTTENLPGTIASIEEIYEQHFPGNPFLYSFADEQFNRQYENDQRFATLFTVFAVLAIFIACLGLFGLAAYTSEQRTKEIGVRKVLGASAASISNLLSKDFLKLVLIGFVIAVPIAWYTMNRWLEEFAYRIDIGPGVFLLAGLAAALIAFATVSWHAVKSAMMNPVDSLRSE